MFGNPRLIVSKSGLTLVVEEVVADDSAIPGNLGATNCRFLASLIRRTWRIPRRFTVPSLAVRTCSITAHCAPVMFHTLKTTIAVWPAVGIVEAAGLSNSPSSSSSLLSFDEKSTIYLFIYLPREGKLPRQKATTRPIHRPCLLYGGWTKIDPLQGGERLHSRVRPSHGGNCLGKSVDRGIVFTGDEAWV